MIQFENVIKKYKNQKKPAVDKLNLKIEKGEICMLVGPSGCGKTTTMKMINRLIEPTSGNIYVNGKNILEINPTDLRLDIGYVIQNTGLFPHMTIEENIATVPIEKGWSKTRIKERVEELMELVELDPKTYAKKKPGALSGGQQQRVGVARALAGDPPVMLMDEPFGALDPITRSNLQDEFLRIQEKVHKTIIFVTHDIDEAIKMGDTIVVMRDGKVVQRDTPDEILTHPADEFVEDLIGGNSPIKRMNLIRCEEVMQEIIKIPSNMEVQEAQTLAFENNVKVLGVVDSQGNYAGYVRRRNLRPSSQDLRKATKQITHTVGVRTTLQDALSEMLSAGRDFIFVRGRNKEIQGLIHINDLLKAVNDDDR
ncbi:MAG: betaine/proline/choline family ABC transporter ATP-binding protein [Epulopiscium sp.]|nr:betaine/proline/choline family ABC transporter ATP-binding protein [Candidatus Epulonipiscium sp.]